MKSQLYGLILLLFAIMNNEILVLINDTFPNMCSSLPEGLQCPHQSIEIPKKKAI